MYRQELIYNDKVGFIVTVNANSHKDYGLEFGKSVAKDFYGYKEDDLTALKSSIVVDGFTFESFIDLDLL